tara:strand:- start:1712 stop:1999 length:288 start_codon:yes stop_codon:yes gene_type:complete
MADAKKTNVDERVLTITKEGQENVEVKFSDLDDEGKVLFNKFWLIKKEKETFISESNFKVEQLNILEKSYLSILQSFLEKPDGEEKKDNESSIKT